MAKLYYYYGTMNAGKSVNLLKDAHNYEQIDRTTIIMKPRLDSRGKEGYISCRIEGISKEAILFDIDENIYETISSIIDDIQNAGKKVGAVFIDEAQFMTKDQVFQVSDIPDFKNVPVLCYGLRTDAFGNLFEGSKALFELADAIKEIKSMCVHSNSKATMVYRVDEAGIPIKSGGAIDIGGNEKYKACSRREYKKIVLGYNID